MLSMITCYAFNGPNVEQEEDKRKFLEAQVQIATVANLRYRYLTVIDLTLSDGSEHEGHSLLKPDPEVNNNNEDPQMVDLTASDSKTVIDATISIPSVDGSNAIPNGSTTTAYEPSTRLSRSINETPIETAVHETIDPRAEAVPNQSQPISTVIEAPSTSHTRLPVDPATFDEHKSPTSTKMAPFKTTQSSPSTCIPRPQARLASSTEEPLNGDTTPKDPTHQAVDRVSVPPPYITTAAVLPEPEAESSNEPAMNKIEGTRPEHSEPAYQKAKVPIGVQEGWSRTRLRSGDKVSACSTPSTSKPTGRSGHVRQAGTACNECRKRKRKCLH